MRPSQSFALFCSPHPQDCSHGVIYPLATVLVNLTNSYERPEIIPEMRELAKYSKQHVPEEDPRDAAEFVRQRVARLVAAGCPSALFTMTTRSAELPTAGEKKNEVILPPPKRQHGMKLMRKPLSCLRIPLFLSTSLCLSFFQASPPFLWLTSFTNVVFAVFFSFSLRTS